jgi:hypothetical protein
MGFDFNSFQYTNKPKTITKSEYHRLIREREKPTATGNFAL